MKKLAIIILLIITSCKEKQELSDHYRGYVYNLKREPLGGVKVYAFGYPSQYTHTQKNGYFLLGRRNQGFVDNLIFEKKGYIKDTVASYSANRRGDRTHFLTQQSDTLIMEVAK